ncbi:MAG: O-antigen ligase family protein [Candidatus Thiodiazotropha weberae]|nr:O-antigen ligase family protein [Candidatus Thiodiazotropha lotti]MCG8010166.1 O-antigen ligase family protein [Candidatus Thiodiazotropha lotti]MCG8021637.1 O-antigen ligase family protein [Candidatus Thiodiazotropha lotti]MCW4208806.1 O-antigen ligase family protein [Candidatus Thiodiazotropha lotti]MCW4209624.1 O-antigen ligase family protein [Candidatus Thiodiazotropha lotti]
MLLFVFNKPYIAVIGYLVMVFCKTQEYYPIFATIKSELVFGLIILIRVLFKLAEEESKLKFSHQINKTIWFFFLTVTLSYALSWDKEWSWDRGYYPFLKVMIIYLLVLLSIDNRKQLFSFVISFLGIYVYLVYEPAYNYLHGVGGDTHHYGDIYTSEFGLLSGHVALANNVNQVLPFFILLPLVQKSHFKKILYYIPSAIMLIALIGSGSRGGVAGLVVCAFLIAFYSKKRMMSMIGIGAMALVLILTTNLQYTASRFEFQSASATGRFTGFTHGVGMLLKGNVAGVGPGCYALARERYFTWRLDSHNIYGQVIGELGIPGTIAWFFLILYLFKSLSRSIDTYRKHGEDQKAFLLLSRAVQISLLVRLFVSIASHGLYFYYWYLIAAITILIEINAKKLDSED